MSRASQIVSALLEADEELDPADVNINPEDYLHQYADQIEKDAAEGKVTAQTALTAQGFWHRTEKYSNGRTAIHVRRNGATKTWKTRPGAFRIPVKYGFRDYFYIDNHNADEWSIQPIPDLPKPPRRKLAKRKSVLNPSSLMPPASELPVEQPPLEREFQQPPPRQHPELPLSRIDQDEL